MTTSNKSVHRSLVTLGLPQAVPTLISYAGSVVQRMTGNPHFPNPTPSLASVASAADDLQAAQTGALSGLKGSVALREAKRKALVTQLQGLRNYVQSIANADETNGLVIIESAGLAARKQATRKARVFTAKPGPNAGTATLVAGSSGHRAAYEWQYSIDGGKTWVAAPPTLQAKTTVAGLTSGTSVQFRYRPVTRTGAADWSAPTSLTMA